MKFSKILSFSLVASLALSCSDDNSSQISELSFSDVEALFEMKEPHKELTKQHILEKYGTVQAYYDTGFKKKEELEILNTKRRENLEKTLVWYNVTLTNPRVGLHTTIRVHHSDYILLAAEEQGIDLPYSCRCGGETSSVAKQISGRPADQSDQFFLTDNDIEDGWVLLDVASPTSDSKFLTHQEEEFWTHTRR